MSKPVELGSLKIGSYILLPVSDQPTGDPCRVVEYDTSKPGKHGSAKARIVGVGVFDNQKRPHVGPVSIQVMDSETFETIDVDLIDDEVEGKLEQGQDIEYWNVMGRTKIMRIKSS